MSSFPVAKQRNGKTYYRRTCKKCRSDYERSWRENRAKHVRDYQARYYEAHRDRKLETVRRWQRLNREYKLAYQRAWYLANQDRLTAKQRAWYEKNRAKAISYREGHREEIAARMKRWRAEYKDEITSYQRKWRVRHRADILDYARTYRKEKPEVKRLSEATRRARKAGSNGRVTIDQIMVLWRQQQGKCVYCGAALLDNYEIDHKTPLARGGTHDFSNIQLLCASCNRKKHTKTHTEFLRQIRVKGLASGARRR